MKNSFFMKISIALILVCSLFFTQVSASVDLALQDDNARALASLGILKGYPDGSLGIKDNIKRSEFFTMVVRILGYDSDIDTNDVKLPFKDIDKSHWAYNNIRIAYKYGLITGNPDNTITPNNYITYPEVLAVLIRALGYENPAAGKWPNNVIDMADGLGMLKNVDIPANKQVTRGEVSVIIYNTLTVDFK